MVNTQRISTGLRSVGAAAVMAAGLLATGCAADEAVAPQVFDEAAEQPESLELDVTSQSRVRLHATRGTIWLRAADDAEAVTIEAVKRVESTRPDLAVAYLDQVQVDYQLDDDLVQLRSVHPDPSTSLRYAVDYDVVIPHGMVAEIINDEGDVYAGALKAPLEIDTNFGNVILWNLHGNAYVNVTEGYIDATATVQPQGLIHLGTHRGWVGLNIPTNTSAKLTAVTGDGVIRVDNLELSGSSDDDDSLLGTLGTGDANISVVTVEGDIAVAGF